jgi:hypothetical protein
MCFHSARLVSQQVTTERQYRLVCNIQGGAGSTVQVAHLHEGIKMGLVSKVTAEYASLWSMLRRET